MRTRSRGARSWRWCWPPRRRRPGGVGRTRPSRSGPGRAGRRPPYRGGKRDRPEPARPEHGRRRWDSSTSPFARARWRGLGSPQIEISATAPLRLPDRGDHLRRPGVRAGAGLPSSSGQVRGGRGGRRRPGPRPRAPAVSHHPRVAAETVRRRGGPVLAARSRGRSRPDGHGHRPAGTEAASPIAAEPAGPARNPTAFPAACVLAIPAPAPPRRVIAARSSLAATVTAGADSGRSTAPEVPDQRTAGSAPTAITRSPAPGRAAGW